MWPFDESDSNSLPWGNDPMCFERHLARRVGNSLWPVGARKVRARELEAAQAWDQENAGRFRKAFEEHVRQGLAFGGRVGTVEELSEYFKKSLELLERASQIGGSWNDEVAALEAGMEAAKKILVEALQNRQAAELLGRFETLCRLQIDTPLIAQIIVESSPFRSNTDEWIRAMLTEDESQLERCGTWAGGMGMQIMDRAKGILRAAVCDGFAPFEAHRKLVLLRAAYDSGKNLVTGAGKGKA